MEHFDSCPDSILQDVLSRVSSPSDLIAMSLTCKRMRDLVPPCLRLREKFRKLSASFIEEGTWLSFGTRPFDEFREILKRRDLGVCVYEATMEIGFVDLLHPTGNSHLLPQSEELRLLETAVDELGVRDWEGSGRFLETLRSGGAEARAALFLLMLRNLEKLSFRNFCEDVSIRWVLRNVVSLDLPQRLKLSYGFLSLREVTISHWGTEFGFELDRLAPFFLLPSLEKLFGFMVDNDEIFEWDGEFGVSSVTEIKLEMSYVSVKALGEFLRIPKALKKFTYKFGGAIISDVAEYDYNEILRVVTQTQPMLPLSNIDIVVDETAGYL